MMKFIVLLCLLLQATVVLAQSTTRIISIDAFDLSYTGGLMIRNDKARRGWTDRDETTFRLNLNFAQDLPQYVGLMWRARFFFNREDIEIGQRDLLYSNFGGAGGLLYNFDAEDVKNSIFAATSVGLERATLEEGKQDESGFNIFFEIEAGKRWDLGRYAFANISYAPTVSLQFKRYGGGIRDEYYTRGTEFKLNFLKFDMLF